MRLITHIIAPTKEAFPVKQLSKTQSRKHINKRKAKVAARHAKAGHWTAQAQPMLGSGMVHYSYLYAEKTLWKTFTCNTTYG